MENEVKIETPHVPAPKKRGRPRKIYPETSAPISQTIVVLKKKRAYKKKPKIVKSEVTVTLKALDSGYILKNGADIAYTTWGELEKDLHESIR